MRTRRLEYLSFSAQLAEVHAGRVTFDRFIQASRPVWRRYALYLLRRWKPPTSVSVDDMEQELILAAWRALQTYEEGRTDLKRYVVFSACDKAKKWLHKQRDAYRRDDKSPSRAAMTFTAMGCETAADVERFLEDDSADPSELVLARAEALEVKVRWSDAAIVLDDRERVVAHVIGDCGGDLASACDEIRGDPGLRVDLKLVTDEAVTRLVHRTAWAAICEYTTIQERHDHHG